MSNTQLFGMYMGQTDASYFTSEVHGDGHNDGHTDSSSGDYYQDDHMDDHMDCPDARG